MEPVGLEPTMPGAGDLQSPGVTNFPTTPYTISKHTITLPLIFALVSFVATNFMIPNGVSLSRYNVFTYGFVLLKSVFPN